MPTLEEIPDDTIRATLSEKDDDGWNDEDSDALVSAPLVVARPLRWHSR